MKKIIKTDTIDSFDEDYWNGPVDELVDRLNGLKTMHSRYDVLSISSDFHWDGPATYSLTGTRLETDEELETRKKKSVAARKAAVTKKQKQEEEEKEQLAKLLKKYPNFT